MPTRFIVIAGSRRYTFDAGDTPQYIRARLDGTIEKAWVESQGTDNIWMFDRLLTNEFLASLGMELHEQMKASEYA